MAIHIKFNYEVGLGIFPLTIIIGGSSTKTDVIDVDIKTTCVTLTLQKLNHVNIGQDIYSSATSITIPYSGVFLQFSSKLFVLSNILMNHVALLLSLNNNATSSYLYKCMKDDIIRMFGPESFYDADVDISPVKHASL